MCIVWKVVFPTAQLKGIFFGAAVTADKSFLSMDVTSFQQALFPKVRFEIFHRQLCT